MNVKIIEYFYSSKKIRNYSLILKGGTALRFCYQLNRFSEDIDLDAKSPKVDLESLIKIFTKINNFSYRIAINTDTVKRYMVNYGNTSHPLKIELSFRDKNIVKDTYTEIDGIIVYTLDYLCELKSLAYNARDKIRDLYDVTFICKRWWNNISDRAKSVIRNIVKHKGIEHFDYIVQTQDDKLINKSKLADDFLDMFDKLELLLDNEEILIIEETINNLNSAQNKINKNSINEQDQNKNINKDSNDDDDIVIHRPKM